jgi:predicted PurR-regulated permease PerM
MDKETRPNWFRRLVLVIIVLASAFSLYIIRNTLIPLFVSMLIAYLLTPLADYLEHRGFGRIPAITITFFLFFGFLFLVVLYLFPLIKNQVGDLTAGLPRNLVILNTRIAQLQARLAEYWPAIEQVDVGARIQKVALDTLNAIPTYVANIFSFFPLLILVPLISFFFLKDGRRIRRGFLNSVPNRYFEMVMGLLHEVDQKIGSYVRGQILRSTVIGFLTFLGLKLCGLKYSLLLAIFAGVMNLIPYAGPLIGSIPALVLAILNQANPDAFISLVFPLPLVVQIALVYIIVQTLDAIWVAPYILGWSVDIHPLGIVLVLLFGNQLFGWWGIILAVPVASIIRLTIQAIASRYRIYQA